MQNHFLLEKSETNSLPSYVQKDRIQGALSSHLGWSPPASLIGRNWLNSRHQFPNLFSEETNLVRCRLTGWRVEAEQTRCMMLRRRSKSDLCFPGGPPLGGERDEAVPGCPGVGGMWTPCCRNLPVPSGPAGQSMQNPTFLTWRIRKHWIYDRNFRSCGHLEFLTGH